MKSGGV
jgi:phosphoribosyl-dephospho-CoA transferase